jgi:hypothetical protein
LIRLILSVLFQTDPAHGVSPSGFDSPAELFVLSDASALLWLAEGWLSMPTGWFWQPSREGPSFSRFGSPAWLHAIMPHFRALLPASACSYRPGHVSRSALATLLGFVLPRVSSFSSGPSWGHPLLSFFTSKTGAVLFRVFARRKVGLAHSSRAVPFEVSPPYR